VLLEETHMDRRAFLTGTMGSLVLAARSADLYAQRGAAPASVGWDAGQLRHLLPTVSDTEMLIKASFVRPLTATPNLRVGTTTIRGQMSDTAGELWQFRAAGLRAHQSYRLALTAANGQALCEPWNLSTFPSADATADRFRVLFFTCAGGPDSPNLTSGNLPTAIRNRLLRRGLSFQPQAAVANGDHVYWDLHSPRVPPNRRNNTRLESFDRIEQHSFTIADFLADRITLRFFKWDVKSDPLEKIDTLDPFRIVELPRPV
jgi:hypothetical protein